jgi:hypothetical protein
VDFRWVAFITLWTFLVGPIFGASGGPAPARKPPAPSAKTLKPRPAPPAGVNPAARAHSCASGNSGARTLASSRITVSASAR